MYERVVKRCLDAVAAFFGMCLLALPVLILMLLVWLDDPGPVFFTQKRVGKDRKIFRLIKFRSMKMSTPHDTPTHLLADPEQYITRIGRFLRKSSLDELPQLWNIFCGQMSFVGPRPALWNQDDLLAERDRYGANAIRPGLTGWAQINGRDELSISEKAALDGKYAARMRQGGMTAFRFDLRCFFGTFAKVLRGSGVVEGGPDRKEKP